jgi:heme oxygenase
MDLNNIFSSYAQSDTNSVIQKDLDHEKYEKILRTMCDKRRAIENILKDTSLDATAREENALTLMQLKQDMTMFGISEVDYQIYLNKHKEEEAPTLPFTS